MGPSFFFDNVAALDAELHLRCPAEVGLHLGPRHPVGALLVGARPQRLPQLDQRLDVELDISAVGHVLVNQRVDERVAIRWLRGLAPAIRDVGGQRPREPWQPFQGLAEHVPLLRGDAARVCSGPSWLLLRWERVVGGPRKWAALWVCRWLLEDPLS